MALSFSEAFGQVMSEMSREILIDDYCWIKTEPFQAVTQETRDAAAEWADKIIAGGKAMDYLEATAAKPCECCGRI